MKLAVFHRTTFIYSFPVTHSVNTLHLEPRTFPYQKTISALIRVIPATRVRRFTDLFQNITQHFELPGPHTRLEIESRIRVHNLPLDISQASREATSQGYNDPSIREQIWQYLQESRWVSRHPEVWREALDITRGFSSVFDQSMAIMSWIHREFAYEQGVTTVNTHLEEAFEMKRGVCQDFTHVMLGLCRAVNIPARYASGYLYNGPRDTLVGAQASHAWAEIYIPAAGWIGFDPTNNTLADERYVKVAVGRDYEDVTPVRGNYRGTGHCRMEVQVEVEKI
ncbi:transglutaminase family protein [Luteolibacter yonseiensis]|uniref:Transglutaminase family protein n=2 Tax=Luteolibacter yonseiensis TaxID=1144680 RepID=A0A934RA88_9BACT|nr:transglutaminase family protein [Luteolibacter yonseiensis]MBK1817864.1 transglutaminase family protein [Luteolibacter yonseiensis]